MTENLATVPRPIVWRRVHSLLGLWIVLFLMEHLFTNSQAALLAGHHGAGFIRAVNIIKNLPFIHALEIVLIGVPILFHGVWGIKYALQAKQNVYGKTYHEPRMGKYPRNHAYFWQRVTSWILLLGIIFHVGYMRFYRYPVSVHIGKTSDYFVRVKEDPGLDSVAKRLGVTLYDQNRVEKAQKTLAAGEKEQKWIDALTKRSLNSGEVIAVTHDFGTATLLVVRDTFESVVMALLYTIFVLSAVFHAFNGLWTFLITWGVVIKMRSQSLAVNWCVGLMALIGFLGLAAVWGTYFINLRV